LQQLRIFPASENASVVTAARIPVEEGEWTEIIGELNIGDYAVIALCEGRDGRTKASVDAMLFL